MHNDHNSIKNWIKNLFSRNEILFGTVFGVVFLITFSILYSIGLIPIEFLGSSNGSPSVVEKLQDNSLKQIGLSVDNDSQKVSYSADYNNDLISDPIRIEAASIGLNSIIKNPSTTDYRELDNALLQGAVHYPGSGNVETGNMFIFGHSTGYRIVNNKAFQVFNNIHSLENGDEIKIYTTNKEYVYKVISVKLVDSREELISFNGGSGHLLTLSTCNSFGQKTDRYVVQAQFDHTIDI